MHVMCSQLQAVEKSPYSAWWKVIWAIEAFGRAHAGLNPPTSLQVAMHTEYYTRPRLQRHVIRILWYEEPSKAF